MKCLHYVTFADDATNGYRDILRFICLFFSFCSDKTLDKRHKDVLYNFVLNQKIASGSLGSGRQIGNPSEERE